MLVKVDKFKVFEVMNHLFINEVRSFLKVAITSSKQRREESYTAVVCWCTWIFCNHCFVMSINFPYLTFIWSTNTLLLLFTLTFSLTWFFLRKFWFEITLNGQPLIITFANCSTSKLITTNQPPSLFQSYNVREINVTTNCLKQPSTILIRLGGILVPGSRYLVKIWFYHSSIISRNVFFLSLYISLWKWAVLILT